MSIFAILWKMLINRIGWYRIPREARERALERRRRERR